MNSDKAKSTCLIVGEKGKINAKIVKIIPAKYNTKAVFDS